MSVEMNHDNLDTVIAICERLEEYKGPYRGYVRDRMTFVMDLSAANGCNDNQPLNMARLLTFPKGDFMHDVIGIQNHIDRNTGTLGDCFIPRCAE